MKVFLAFFVTLALFVGAAAGINWLFAHEHYDILTSLEITGITCGFALTVFAIVKFLERRTHHHARTANATPEEAPLP